jgi:signal transduction histidine kinase
MQHEGHMHTAPGDGGFFSRLFSASDFTPRAICFNQDPQVIWLHAISDLTITLAYYSIPIALVYLVMKRRDLAFNWMFVLFGGFILLCGTTHLFNLIALTDPVYRLDGLVKATTAAFSIGTAVALWPLIPKALALPSQAILRDANARLENEVKERQAAQEKLQKARDELEQRVQERTAELALHREKLADLVRQRTQELEESHQQLRVSERMAAIGTLSAGLGHDMGNLLLPVRARLDAMERRINEGGAPTELVEDVAAIRTCAEYLQRLSRGLRLLALDPEDGGGETNIQDWWDDVSPMFENVLPRGVEIDSSVARDLPPALISRHALTQAVFNLVQNAGDAMRPQGGGRVTVWARPAKTPGLIEVGVTDTGPGMTDEVRRRCLEPFFTTKTRSISTGLGLTLVHGIVQRAGGTLDIDTLPGKGCTFTLRLKAGTVAAPGPAGPRRLAAVSVADARLRAFAEGLLKAMGFDIGEGDPSSHTELWVADSPRAEDVARYLVQGDGRRAVLIGSDGAELSNPGCFQVREAHKPSLLRDAIVKAAAKP